MPNSSMRRWQPFLRSIEPQRSMPNMRLRILPIRSTSPTSGATSNLPKRRRAMTDLPRRGEVWWCEPPEIGRRPVVVLSRDAAIPRLRRVLVAPCTTTIRDWLAKS